MLVPSVDETRSFDCRLELLGERTGWQDLDGRAHIKPGADLLADQRGSSGRISPTPDFDHELEYFAILVSAQLHLEVIDLDDAERKILELGVIDVDAAKS